MTAATLSILLLAAGLAVATAAGRLSPKHHPVLIAYAVGLSIGATDYLSPDERAVLRAVMRGCVALAIPALLLQTDVAQLRRLGRDGLLAGFALWVGASVAAVIAVGVFAEAPTEVALVLAVFTGSIANLQAAGLALGVEESALVAANVGDVAAGGLLFLGLTGFGPRVVGGVLRKRKPENIRAASPGASATAAGRAHVQLPTPEWKWWGFAGAAAAGSLVVGLGLASLVGATALPPELLVIGAASVVSVAVARAVGRLELGTAGARLGDGLMMAFCVLVGTGANVFAVAGEAVRWAVLMGGVLSVEVTVALLLARVLRVDAKAFLMALAGAVYSPAFVGPVAHAARAHGAIPVGIAWGLIGLALGTPAALAFAAYFPAP